MNNNNELVDTTDIVKLFGCTRNNSAINDEKQNEDASNVKSKMNGVINLNDFIASTILQLPPEDVTADFTLDLKDEVSISTDGMLYQSPFAFLSPEGNLRKLKANYTR